MKKPRQWLSLVTKEGWWLAEGVSGAVSILFPDPGGGFTSWKSHSWSRAIFLLQVVLRGATWCYSVGGWASLEDLRCLKSHFFFFGKTGLIWAPVPTPVVSPEELLAFSYGCLGLQEWAYPKTGGRSCWSWQAQGWKLAFLQCYHHYSSHSAPRSRERERDPTSS